MDKIILHIDMNSYFASVEQQANPFLRGKPVGVCAYLSNNGCIIASSIEAKRLGIKTGCRAKEARAIYPNIVLVENDPAKYRSITKKIFRILNRYTDKIELYSIDEAFLDLTGYLKNFDEVKQKAREIQKNIKREVGEWLGTSVGISYTKFLAKLASDYTSPNSILVLKPVDLDNFLSRINLTDIWGINVRLAVRLNSLGIINPLDLKNYPVANLMQSLGKIGYYLWANLNGIELGDVQKAPEPKSIGHSYCLPRITNDTSYHRQIFMKLCEKTGRRLRDKNLTADGLDVHWRYAGGDGYGTQRRLKRSIFNSADIFRETNKLFQEYYNQRPVTMLAVTVFLLHSPSQQLMLFQSKNQINSSLTQALDCINNLYGEYSIFWGTMWGTGKNAPDRIGFRKTVSAESDD